MKIETSKTTSIVDRAEASSNVLSLEEKRLLWKCDRHIMPILVCLFVLNFLDRVNIGNSKIQGLEEDLNMKNNDYNIALFVLFIPLILCDIPSTVILKRVAPSTWISGIVFMFGVVTICEGLVTTYAGLVTARFFLGLFEAGLTPGCIYLISMYYKRYELQWRLTMLFIGSILASGFGGLFAYAIAHLDGVSGYRAWRWIFIIEGLITVVVAGFGKWLIVDWPETAKFLNEEERTLLMKRLAAETSDAAMSRLDRPALRRIVLDWKLYVGMLMYLGVANTGLALGVFLPSIIHELGFTAEASQIRSVPVFVAAGVSAVTTAYLTDRLRHRFSFTIIGVAVGSIGYIMLLTQQTLAPGVQYFATFLVACGGYIAQPVTIAWLNNNMAGHYKRGAGTAVQYGGGNIAGLIASNIFLNNQAPSYPLGYAMSLALMVFCGIMCCVFYIGLTIENRKRDRGLRDWRLDLPENEKNNLGDDHPSFRFVS